LKSLESAKDIKAVEKILVDAGIDASKIDAGVLNKIVSSKKVTYISDVINYGANKNVMSVVANIFKNP
jgi:hypothetical protein